nr:MerR family DNA-binding transcriptional regulator [Hyphomicrobiales bacterium]
MTAKLEKVDRTADYMQKFFTIGQVAREFEVTHRALRFYEDKGLIQPQRNGQNRLYSRRDLARLKLVLMGKRVGFSLSDIRDMMDLYDLRDGRATQLRVSLDKFESQIKILEVQQRDVDEALTDLRRTRDLIAGMLTEREQAEAG